MNGVESHNRNTQRVGYVALATSLLMTLLIPASLGAQSRDMEIMEAYQNTVRRLSGDVLPVVVEVEIHERVGRDRRGVPSPLDFFFGRPGESIDADYERHAVGSGVVVRRDDENVYVLTNDHIAGGADGITVRLHDGREFDGRLVGADHNRDLALIVFQTAEEIPVATLGDSDGVEIGDFVLAVGNPHGLEATITSGIVSARGRGVSRSNDRLPVTNYIKTDVTIHRENSGGALVNLQGEVIGLTTWIDSGNGGNIGPGFAIPINSAVPAIEQFITSGRTEYGWLGVNMADPPSSPSDSLRESEGGAFVFNVYQRSPAAQAGIQPGDIIVRVGNETIRGGNDLLQTVTSLAPGDETRFFVKRNGEMRNVYVTTGVRPSNGREIKSSDLWPGMSVVEITEQIRTNLDLSTRGGNLIIGHVANGSPAATAGLRSGDIITKVDDRDVGSLRDFYMELNGTSGDEITFQIRRNDTNLTIGLAK